MRNSVAAAQGDLSNRELEVLGLLSSRLTTHENSRNAVHLCEHDEVTPRTIYRKQGMALRVDAVR
jgi:hypothetical protein